MIKKSDELLKGEKAEEETILLTTLMKKMEILEKFDADVMELSTEESEITEEIKNTTEHNDKMFSAIAKTELALKYSFAWQVDLPGKCFRRKRTLSTAKNVFVSSSVRCLF